MGSYLRVLSKSYPMNTNMTGYRCFTKIFAFACFGRKQPQHWNCLRFIWMIARWLGGWGDNFLSHMEWKWYMNPRRPKWQVSSSQLSRNSATRCFYIHHVPECTVRNYLSAPQIYSHDPPRCAILNLERRFPIFPVIQLINIHRHFPESTHLGVDRDQEKMKGMEFTGKRWKVIFHKYLGFSNECFFYSNRTTLQIFKFSLIVLLSICLERVL